MLSTNTVAPVLGLPNQTAQPRKMNPAHIMDLASVHPGTIRGDDPAQFRYRQGWAVFRHQAISAQPPAPVAPVAPIAGDIQRAQTVGDLAEGDNS